MASAVKIWLGVFGVLVVLGIGGIVYKPISERIADKIIADEIKREVSNLSIATNTARHGGARWDIHLATK